MNLKTPLLTSAALLLAATAFAAPAQAFAVIGPTPGPAINNPCDHMVSPDPEVQAVINACRQADDNLVGAVNQLLQIVLANVPNGELPDDCSTQENVVPFVLECAAWAIDQIPDIPGSGEIVAMVNALIDQIKAAVDQVIAQAAALAQWGQDYVLIDVAAWYDATGAQASEDIAAEGTWVLAQTGYSAALGGWADGVGDQAVVDAGREATYAGATAGVVATNVNNYAAYVNSRLFSPVPCGSTPAVVQPGIPPVPVVPGIPPTPSNPPVPTVPGLPPTPHDPPLY
jgi:hypothetical protein